MTLNFNENRYNEMIYRKCGRSGIHLPLISLGLWHNFGDVDDFENAKSMIFKSFDLGITHFDLANNYGPSPGSAERNFGKILKEDLYNHRDELIISTKVGYLMWDGPYGEWGSRKHMIASLDQSLKRLQLDYVDVFYHHRPDPDTPLEETMMTLDHIVRQGKALYVGLSNYDHIQTEKAVKILNELGTPILIHQPKYNMFTRWIESDLLSVLEDKGIGCISFSPLAQGMLTDKYINGIPADSRAANKHGFLQPEAITKSAVAKIKKLNKVAQERDQTLAQLALVWNLRNKGMTSVLIGARSVRQIEENINSINNLEISEEELKTIDEILSE
ncbi:L-glyceraldehyde 3-phosphate reductase [hydrothermal vent metagenome]|uniref:L-glyceraldehyde 3-phosphate reductase n=1 Tax=hydrothermal vent metagenome TaxID=652676 RepID=A0A3B1CLR3_9ZZZZ